LFPRPTPCPAGPKTLFPDGRGEEKGGAAGGRLIARHELSAVVKPLFRQVVTHASWLFIMYSLFVVMFQLRPGCQGIMTAKKKFQKQSQDTCADHAIDAAAYMRTGSAANVGDDKDSQARQWAAISKMFFVFNMFFCVCHVRQKCELANRSESTFLRSEREWRGEARRGEAIGEAKRGKARRGKARTEHILRRGQALHWARPVQ
jgi:hypothetical protein